jgi:hypothetical protein
MSMAFLAAACATLAGCGGDGQEAALARSEFLTRDDGVCRQAQRQFDRAQRTAPATPEQIERQLEALIDVSRQALNELEALGPPPSLRQGYERYLAARDRALGLLEDGRDAVAARDAVAYLAAKRKVSSDLATRLELAREVGLKACSRPSLTLVGG